MTKTLKEFQKTFRVEELVVLKNDHWTWSLRPVQCTLGASVISLNEFSTRLSDVPDAAGKDYIKMVKIAEGVLNQCFCYDKINHLMLMMVDSHVHYHVIPRYSGDKNMFKNRWVDDGWPAFPNIAHDHLLGNEELTQQVLNFIREKSSSHS